MANRIQLRRGTAEQWAAANPILAQGEPGIESDTGKQKFGNGTSRWNSLTYASKGDRGPAGPVSDSQIAEQVTAPNSETRTALNATIATGVAPLVPPLVADAIANDPSVAANAAELAQSDAGLIRKTDPGAPSSVDLLSPKRDWRHIDVDKNYRIMQGLLNDGTRMFSRFETPHANLAGAVVTNESILGWESVDLDANDRIIRGVKPDGTVYVGGAAAEGQSRDIVTWTDSLGAWTTSFPIFLSADLANRGIPGVIVHQRGVGGEPTMAIAARQGALPYIVTVPSGSIPASGGVTVTFESAGGGSAWPLLRGNEFPVAMGGTLAGVKGTLTKTPATPWNQSDVHQASDVYTFTRTTAGSAVTLNRPTPLVLDDAIARLGDIMGIWAGRNNADARAITDIRAMVNNRSVRSNRFFIFTIPNGAGEGIGTTAYANITARNSELAAEHRRNVIDVRRYLIDYGLADLGITPTAQDNADIAEDIVPASLRVDAIHLTEAAQRLLSRLAADRLIELGAFA